MYVNRQQLLVENLGYGNAEMYDVQIIECTSCRSLVRKTWPLDIMLQSLCVTVNDNATTLALESFVYSMIA